MKKVLWLFLLVCFACNVFAQTDEPVLLDSALDHDVQEEAVPDSLFEIEEAFFSDKLLVDGYAKKIGDESKEFLLAMINDDNIPSYRKAAAARVFRDKFASSIVAKEKKIVERVLLRQVARAVMPYVQIELMHTLLAMDRYRHFNAMIPALIRKMSHYDEDVSQLAFDSIKSVLDLGTQRAREARIVFNTLRKVFFLSRKKLANANTEEVRLKNKLELLRWSVKVLGSEYLKRLPPEVINLM